MWQKERHVTFVVYLLSLIWILPLIPSFFLPPTPHFLIPNSFYVHLLKNKTLSELLWCYRHCCIGQEGLSYAAVTNSPLFSRSLNSKGLCVACATVHPAWPGRGSCFTQGSRPVGWWYMKTYHPWWARGKGSSDPKGEIAISGHSSEWVTGFCPFTRESGNVFLPRT